MKHLLLLISTFIFCFFTTNLNKIHAQGHQNCGHQHHQHGDQTSELKLSKLKAAYMYLILTQYVDWEETDISTDEYRIGFVGENPLVQGYLEQGARKLRKKGQAVTFERWGDDPNKSMADYHALFIGQVDDLTYESVLLQTLGTNVITFRDDVRDAKIDKLVTCDKFKHEEKTLTKKERKRKRKAKKRVGKVNKTMLEATAQNVTNTPEPLIQFKIVDNKLKFKVTEKSVAGAVLSDFILDKSYNK